MAKKLRITSAPGASDREKTKMIADLTGEETATGRRKRKKTTYQKTQLQH